MFHEPLYFLFLIPLPWLAWRLFSQDGERAIRFSSVQVADAIRPTLRQRMMWLPKVLTLLGLFMLIVGLARPREGRDRTVVESEGIAIEMVVDRSGSMRALDFKLDGENVDRLTAVKNVASKFVLGEGDLNGRFSDLIGLITFAGYADGVTPATLDHGFLVGNLNETQIAASRNEDGTAIGDAIALAVEKLNSLDQRQQETVKSKIVILLTDGENSAGRLEPLAAAELASTMEIKIYTIGVGTQGKAPFPISDPFSRRSTIRYMDVRIDEDTLTKIADVTGGKYFRATDTDSLKAIYQEIDDLEKTKVESEQYVDYRELAVQSYRGKWGTIPPVLMLAFGLVFTRILLQQTWLRELH